ncbi:hypothetical protein F5X96DRAFT_319561 [Biscogniauxia mediterranea]|nr:hypothetical protein F5X96DRAFT_319561 [Biscogniauxia mediterranea]
MHIQIPSPNEQQSAGVPPNPSPYSVHSDSPLTRIAGRNYVELDDLKAEDAGHGHAHPERDATQTPDNLPPRPMPAFTESGDGNGWWLFEIAAWVASAIALVAIIITIALTDGKPLPQWPMHITLNSFVSFMSTIMKAALIIPVAEGISQLKWLWFKRAGDLDDIQTFDEASRGSWGSMKLIFSSTRLHLAKLGAFITIVALGVDPFIQQVIVYPYRTIPSPTNNVSVPIAHRYNDYAYGGIMSMREPTLEMKAAINNGVYDTNDHPQDDFRMSTQCATGNCTWPETYLSLAVCSKCANTTSLITQNCTTSGSLSYCEYSLPNGMYFDGLMRGQFYMNATGALPTINFNNTQSTVASLTTMRGLHDLSSTTLFGVVSNECVLYFCVNEYRAEVENDNFTETVIASYTGDADPVMGENVTITVPPSGNRTAAQDFVVTATSWEAMSLYFADFWTGNVTGQVGRMSSTSDVMTALYDLGEDGSGSGAQKPGGENNTVAAVAASMTRILRLWPQSSRSGGAASEDPADARAVGTVWVTETYVRVRWPWMALPVAIEGLALIFLIGTIIQSKMSGVAVWKSSTMPMLEGKVRELQETFSNRRH